MNPVLAGSPEWMTYIVWAGYLAGAAIPIALFFKGFRTWVGNQWVKLRKRWITRREIDTKLQSMREHIDESINQNFAILVEMMTGVQNQLKEVVGIQNRVGLLESMLRISADRDQTTGTIYCNERGEVTWVSSIVANWLKARDSDLDGRKWFNYIAPSDRKTIRDEMAQAHIDHRSVRMDISMSPYGEALKPYRLVLSPMPDNPPAQAWAGTLTPVGHTPKVETIQ